jgi:3-hydroxymyristoyl/3-hydroxydecanoyl-(acyl carrier protein) dehydratase
MLSSLYTILKNTQDEIILEFTHENHKIFKAHFPGNPILPGYALIDIISKVLGDHIVYIKKSKFIEHVLPNDLVTFKIKREESKRMMKVYKENKKISEIIYEVS